MLPTKDKRKYAVNKDEEVYYNKYKRIEYEQ